MSKSVAIAIGIVALIVLLVVVQFFGGPSKPTIFADLGFDKAQAQASEAKPPRLLVVEFTAASCEPCAEMDKRVWTNAELMEWLRARALTVKIDFDKDKGHARAFGVQTIPAVVLLDGKKVLTKIEGTQTARELIDKFNAAAPVQPAAVPMPTTAPLPKTPAEASTPTPATRSRP